MFYDIFKKLCDDRGISCKKASAEIGLSGAICAKWKRTGSAPNSDTLVKIADYFEVSVDYLCGRENANPLSSAQESAFYQNFKKLCDSNGVSPTWVATHIMGRSRGAVTAWKKGDSLPMMDAMRKAANYFGVSVSSLLDEETKSEIPEPVSKPNLRVKAEQCTQEAIDAIANIGTIASGNSPLPYTWATTICSALRTAVDHLEIRLLDGQNANVPFQLPKEEVDDFV